MTSELPGSQPPGRAAEGAASVVEGRLAPKIVFTATTFLSALLLFSVQPMFAKMVLPVLGGSPSVWAVAMFFFQSALLVGYCYAHILMRYLPAGAAWVHLALGLAAMLFLPLGLPASWSEPPAGSPYLWQLAAFSAVVGVPFVMVAANAPLLQAWYATTDAEGARNPYFLYAASNLGSLIALLGYPFLLEPALGVRTLATCWTAGFVLLQAAILACAAEARLLKPGRLRANPATVPAAAGATGVGWQDRARWVWLALVPSALLTAFTTHVATDVASAPLVWVIPLALYLLTFVLVFRERALIPVPLLAWLHLVAVVLALLQLSQTRLDTWFVSAATGVAAFFTSAMIAHRTLYESRPAPSHLTEFYLWMSLGGGLGGLFAALVAPQVFSEIYEYPILLALTVSCRPGMLGIGRNRDDWLRLWLLVAGGVLVLFWLPWLLGRLPAEGETTGIVSSVIAPVRSFIDEWGYAAILTGLFATAMVVTWRHPLQQLAFAVLIAAAIVGLPSAVRQGDTQRSFFGVYRVSTTADGEYNILKHGTTLHGAQRVRDGEGNLVVDTTPTTYYYPESPMARTIDIVRTATAERGDKGRYGVIGLGTGSLACYAKPDESWRFFEIDPVVIGIASDPVNFSFLHNCLPHPDIVIGDARLTMSKQPDASFDLIIVDAFSSDAVPVHLMTAESLRMYAAKLKPTGIVLLHISNRYLDLDNVLAATLPLVPELSGLLLSDDAADGSYASSTSTVAVFSKSAAALEALRALPEAKEFESTRLKPWTDDNSDILGPFLAKLR